MEMDTGDQMILAAASMEQSGGQQADIMSRLAQTFSVVLEYLN
jgi:hypothetical protein